MLYVVAVVCNVTTQYLASSLLTNLIAPLHGGFISGEVWWRLFHRYVLEEIVGVLYSIYIDSAICRIVGTAPHLRAPCREAYQNNAQ